ncbi:hypothetical protein MLD38_037810 [Melastoma candidum]|uniref:Uncharacterized protein n=1 Tax=Melastoma candidum TaxID=119954 RepID=A0ACB9LNT9_9MYRT|nr:hypothetical protein MLD38_037810 [Melastoma candidum]
MLQILVMGSVGAAMDEDEMRFSALELLQLFCIFCLSSLFCHAIFHLLLFMFCTLRNEANAVWSIVTKALQILELNQLPSEKLMGIESHPQAVLSRLDLQVGNVQMVGIWGMGGVGKTTVAQAVYNRVASQFEHCCFLNDVRETCEKSSLSGLVQVQQKLLSQLTLKYKLEIGMVDQGINIIKRKVHNKKVLIVLDDVDHPKQLDALAEKCNWFGPGSRIIIMTRDGRLLISQGIEKVYNVHELTNEHALQLFHLTAFHGASPNKERQQLMFEVVEYAKGLPLVIKILGSHLFRRTIPEWKSLLEKLKMAPDGEVFDKLKVSFDGLDDSQKSIFLDVACFFKGERRDHIEDLLQSCGVSPNLDITVLVEKSLIFIEKGRLEMHDMVQDMGREIVQRESTVPGERSRLWSSDNVLWVLEEGTGTKKVRGVKLSLYEPKEVCIKAQALTNMRELKFLIARIASSSGAPIHLPNGLRWLEWCGYSSSRVPFGWKELVKLRLSRSNIKPAGDELKF